MTLRRRTLLQWGLGAAAAAATRSFAQEKYKPMFPVEKDAQLRLLRWSGFVKTDEEVWNQNTKKFQEATGAAVNVEYVAGAKFDDLLEIFVRVERMGTTSITYDHAAYRIDDEGDTLMATAKATLVCIALDQRRAVPIPDAFREIVGGFEQS